MTPEKLKFRRQTLHDCVYNIVQVRAVMVILSYMYVI